MGKQSSPRRFSPEFKADAVALLRSSGRPSAEVARELGVGDTTLRYFDVLDRMTDDIFHREAQVGSAESVETHQGVAELATCEACYRRNAHHVEAIQGAPVTEIDHALRDKPIG